nr:MAG TPA: hypothetical protein [Caudoviricetes sp.]
MIYKILKIVFQILIHFVTMGVRGQSKVLRSVTNIFLNT